MRTRRKLATSCFGPQGKFTFARVSTRHGPKIKLRAALPKG
jgi:hypothetical protein